MIRGSPSETYAGSSWRGPGSCAASPQPSAAAQLLPGAARGLWASCEIQDTWAGGSTPAPGMAFPPQGTCHHLVETLKTKEYCTFVIPRCRDAGKQQVKSFC